MDEKETLLLSLLLFCLVKYSTATGSIICHDCTGVDECSRLLKNEWTGKCTALITGKCFIRRDPNGILYRGCADSLNWPHDLDMTYNGCRYQSYGEWSDTEVQWCFCDHSLCNVNITYIQTTYPGGVSGRVQQGQNIRGQVTVSQGVGYWQRITGSGSGSGGSRGVSGGSGSASGSRIITETLGQNQGQSGVRIQRLGFVIQGQGQSQGQAGAQASSSGVYVVRGQPGSQVQGQGFILQGQTGGQGGVDVQGQDSSGTYESQGQYGGQSQSQGFLVQGQSGNQASGSLLDLSGGSLPLASQRPLVVDPIIYAVPAASSAAGSGGASVIVQRKPGGSSVNLDWDAVQKYLREAKLSGGHARPAQTLPPVVYRPTATLPPVFVGGGGNRAPPVTLPQPTFSSNPNGGVLVQATTPPTLNVAAMATNRIGSVTSRPPTTVEELFSILNALLVELRLTTLTPATNVTQRLGVQLIYDLPADLLNYLRTNLPRDVNSIQSLQYPLYIILYLLSIAGYNINNIVPGLNTSYAGLVPTPAFDIPVNPPNQTNVLASICPSDFIVQPSLGSCYKVITPVQSADARPVAQARARCKEFSRLASLVSVDSVQERSFLSGLLRRETVMLDGWQGWWTSGSYRTGVNQFYWESGVNIPNTSDYWGFQRTPFPDTCVWILQIPNYNYTLGNYDCLTSSGYVCEIRASQATSP